MRYLFAALLLALAVNTQAATTLTLTFTQQQVDATTWAYNKADPSERIAYPTIQLWFANRINNIIEPFIQQKAAAETASVCTKFNAMTLANKTTACNYFTLTTGQTFATDPSGCIATCP